MSGSDELEDVLADARALLDAELDADRPMPDLGDVLQRVRSLDPELDSQVHTELGDDSDDAESEPGAIEPLLGRTPDPGPDPVLAAINADARVLLDGLLEARPAEPAAGAQRRRRGSWRGRRGPLIAAAAATVLFIFGGAALANNWRQSREAAQVERFEALAQAEAASAWEAFPEPPALRYPNVQIPERVASAPPVQLEPEPEPEALEPSGPSLAERLAALDAEAYGHLRAGRLDDAKHKFREITKIGGRSEYAELAFGELFALARRGHEQELDNLWRSYLKRFPRGRYADAARAGTCRRNPEPSKRACWTDYLEKHPRGAARSEALRETAD